MVVDFFCPRWGSEEIAWDIFLKNVKEAGYKGIEWFPFAEDTNMDEVVGLLKKYDLQFCIVMTVLGAFENFDSYLLLLNEQLRFLSNIGDSDRGPLFISVQAGREYFTAEQVDSCLDCCIVIAEQTGVPVYQETHRNKWAYAAHVVPEKLKKNPDVMLTLDVSHWFCVSESYLEDQQEAVQIAINRTRHIHARVGHTQGSQVIDPALPEYAEALKSHLQIWDQWIKERKAEGATSCSITPEFGPPPYLVHRDNNISAQQQQWNLNIYMKDLLHKRYNF